MHRLFPDFVDVEPGDRIRIPDGVTRVQFTSALSTRQHRKLGAWFAKHPAAALRVYGNYDGSIEDLEFLRFYPDLTRFAVDTMYGRYPDVTGLRHLPSALRELGLGIPTGEVGAQTLLGLRSLRSLALAQHKRLPETLGRCAGVTELYIEGPVRDLEALRPLSGVEDLTLRSVSVPDLEPLLGMTGLRSLDIKLGGIRDLDLVPSFARLTYLELWMIRGLADLSFLERATSLEALHLESLRQVMSLPSFASLRQLRSVRLQNMKGLADLAPVAAAPHLEQLLLVEMPFLEPEAVLPFVAHPTLREATLGFGSLRKNSRAEQLLGLEGSG